MRLVTAPEKKVPVLKRALCGLNCPEAECLLQQRDLTRPRSLEADADSSACFIPQSNGSATSKRGTVAQTAVQQQGTTGSNKSHDDSKEGDKKEDPPTWATDGW